tara:strand:+ start:47 stop:436 length:390 start_codon:yes stop_codon:yes gene_type:complete
MIAFQNDMSIPIKHFLNQNLNYEFENKNLLLNKNNTFTFFEVNNKHFPIYNFFKKIDKSNPTNVIKFNVANEYAVNLFKNNLIRYTDIYRIINKISSLNLNYKLKTIKDIVKYHELLERKINETNFKII